MTSNTKKNSYDSRAIANKILKYAETKNLKLTNLQILKLVYLFYGWGLAILDRRLVTQNPQVWDRGPVYPEVYNQFKKFGSGAITDYARDRNGLNIYVADLSDRETRLLEKVVDKYGYLHGFQLSDITHEDGTPWSDALQENGLYSEIPEDAVRDHYNELRGQ